MTGSNPFPPCAVIGKGRQWDGIPLPVEHQHRFWPIGARHNWCGSAKVLFDIEFREGGVWMALTDLPYWCEITEGDARELIRLLRLNGVEAKSATMLRREAQRQWRRLTSMVVEFKDARPLTSRPLRVRTMCSAGREERMIRRLAGADKARTLLRKQARRALIVDE